MYLGSKCLGCPFEKFSEGHNLGCLTVMSDILGGLPLHILVGDGRVSFYHLHKYQALKELNKIMDFLRKIK